MISGHRTEKLLSLGFEIQGLEVGVNYSEKKKQWHKKINKAQEWQWKMFEKFELQSLMILGIFSGYKVTKDTFSLFLLQGST